MAYYHRHRAAASKPLPIPANAHNMRAHSTSARGSSRKRMLPRLSATPLHPAAATSVCSNCPMPAAHPVVLVVDAVAHKVLLHQELLNDCVVDGWDGLGIHLQELPLRVSHRRGRKSCGQRDSRAIERLARVAGEGGRVARQSRRGEVWLQTAWMPMHATTAYLLIQTRSCVCCAAACGLLRACVDRGRGTGSTPGAHATNACHAYDAHLGTALLPTRWTLQVRPLLREPACACMPLCLCGVSG